MQELDLILNGNTRKPHSNVAIFTTFRKDIIVRHLETQHPTKWAEYKKLPINESIRDRFFTDPDACRAILSYIPDQDGFSVVVPGSIVSVIQRLIRRDTVEVPRCADPDIALEVSAFDGLVERQDGSFSLHVAHGLQFKTIIRCISTVSSFRAVVELFTIFSEAYANGKLGHITQELVARTARYAVAINLTAMRVIVEHVWGISILVDGASHSSEGYLDVRLAFECKHQLHNVHFIAIPTGEKAHTAANYAELVVDALINVLGSWILPKVIGIATDGAATMLGCRQGFVKKIRAACAEVDGKGIVANWCGSHQLNLVVGAFLKVFDCFTNFRSTLGFEISFTRTHESVSMLLGTCPEYIKTRWNSIHDTCIFLTQRYEDLYKMQSEKRRDHSSPTWWLCLFLIADITGLIKHCFAELQGKTVTFSEQYRSLNDLTQTLKNKFEDDGNGSGPAMSEVKTEMVICATSAFSKKIYKALPETDRQQLVLSVMESINVLVQGVEDIRIEVLTEIGIKRFTLPAEVIDCEDSSFSDLIDVHRERLREQYGPTIVTDIWNERKLFRTKCETDLAHRKLVDNASRMPLDEAGNKADGGSVYKHLRSFAVGLGSIPPGTHTVEGDFSNLKRIKNEYRGHLSNHALEGHLQAAQYFELLALARSVGDNIHWDGN
jgi:hypothetical protein